MLKIVSTLIIGCLLLSCTAFAQNRKIEFQDVSFEELKEKAQETKKNIFIDCYTTWCGPCKFMSKNTILNLKYSPGIHRQQDLPLA